MKKTNKKLSLNHVTIRDLTGEQLAKASGGVPPTSHINGSFCCTDAGSACTFCACGALTTTCTQYQC